MSTEGNVLDHPLLDKPTASSGNRNEDELLASSIRGKLPQQSPAKGHIFRIPHILRRHNEKVFEPLLFSIGPFHHGKENLQAMEKFKLWYLHCLLDRKPNPETSLDKFIGHIRSMEQYCRDYYDEEIHLDSDEFVEMMVVDGCFIIEFLRMFAQEVPIDTLIAQWMVGAFLNDLLLLENQIPWRVVNCLFTLSSDIGVRSSLPQRSLLPFEGFILAYKPQVSTESLENKHLLDFIRNCLLRSDARKEVTNLAWKPIPSVTELLQAGVKFERGNEHDILNIKFANGVMEVPPIIVQENAESLLRNLIAYEQCEKGRDYKISSYAVLLDNLINSRKDVDFLIEKNIMRTYLSTEDTSCFFNRLCNDVITSKFTYAELTDKVNAYYQGRWHRWLTILRRDYFSNPWSVLSFTAALLILGFTFTQTVYSAMSYYNNK